MLRFSAAMAKCGRASQDESMRAETEKVAEDIKRSVGLLRRHL
jgi:hypothetical protein